METNSYVLIHGKNISHNSLAGSAPHMSVDQLFPALLECFGIILCGYAAGRADVISPAQAQGLGRFVSSFALPALLFKNMVLLDFGNVVWAFLWSVLVAKVTVFVLVCALTLMVAGPNCRYSKAGLYAIFATQSNDFALGYPIVEALYRGSYPEYLQYLYVVAPVSLMLLNPIGFALCEVQRCRERDTHTHATLGVVLQVLKNPSVFIVVVGISSHVAFGRQIPSVLSEFIDGLANSFGGAALFYLGLSMVNQLQKLTRDAAVALILLITAKLLVMPLLCKDMVDLLDAGVNGTGANHTSLSNFAFLYGVFPTAPSVAIYAAHYGVELEVVTSGMVISTFLSAPIMYVSAWLLTIPLMDPRPLVTELENVSFNISIVGLVALVWTIVVMLLSRKFKTLPHLFALNLFIAQFLVCVGSILWNFFVQQEENLLGKILTFTLLYGSLYSTYIWTGLIPVCLALTKRNNLLRLKTQVFMFLGWGVPFLAVGALLISGQRTETIDSAFFYGRSQIVSSAVVLAVSLLLGAVSLMGLSQGEQSGYAALNRAAAAGLSEEPRTPGGPEDRRHHTADSPTSSINSDVHSSSPLQLVPDAITSNGHRGAPCDQQQGPGHRGAPCDQQQGPGHRGAPCDQQQGPGHRGAPCDQQQGPGHRGAPCDQQQGPGHRGAPCDQQQGPGHRGAPCDQQQGPGHRGAPCDQQQGPGHRGAPCDQQQGPGHRGAPCDQQQGPGHRGAPCDQQQGPGHRGAPCDQQQGPGHRGAPCDQQQGPGLHPSDHKQTLRHVLLCLLLSVSLLANLSSCLWWLFNRDPGRLYLELQFFCAVANYGQGFLSFGIFGLDRHLIVLPFKKRLLGLFQGGDSENLGPAGEPEEVRLTCTHFVRYHKHQCVQDIVHSHSVSAESLSAAARESFL